MIDGVHPADAEHLAPLLAETVVMRRLLDDLRTLSLAEAGALPLHREPSDLRAIADEVVASAHTAASAKGVAMSSDGDGALTTSVDPVRVREILANLVANAVRHTPVGGRVAVTVRAIGGDAVLDEILEIDLLGEQGIQVLFANLIILGAGLCRNGESRRHRQTDARHVSEVRALAAE